MFHHWTGRPELYIKSVWESQRKYNKRYYSLFISSCLLVPAVVGSCLTFPWRRTVTFKPKEPSPPRSGFQPVFIRAAERQIRTSMHWFCRKCKELRSLLLGKRNYWKNWQFWGAPAWWERRDLQRRNHMGKRAGLSGQMDYRCGGCWRFAVKLGQDDGRKPLSWNSYLKELSLNCPLDFHKLDWVSQ